MDSGTVLWKKNHSGSGAAIRGIEAGFEHVINKIFSGLHDITKTPMRHNMYGTAQHYHLETCI